MAERLGLPVFVDNDANLAALAEHRAGAARGASEAVVLTIGTGIGGGLILGGELYRGAVGAGGRARPHGDRHGRPAVPGQLPQPRLRRGAGLRHGAGPRGARGWPASGRDSGLGRALGRRAASSPGRWSPSSPTTATPPRIEAIELIGTRLGVAIASLVNIFNPEVVVIGGGVIAAGELLLAPARAEVARAGAAARRGTWCGSSPPRFGVEAGMVGAAALALRRSARGAARVSAAA